MNWMILVTLALAAGVIAWAVQRQRRRRRLGELAELPDRVVNPRLYKHLRSIRAWELVVEQPAQACSWACESAGKRFPGDVAVPLPIAGCGRSCQCRYLAVTEHRRRQRRRDAERRHELRFDTEEDRRHTQGRRKEDHWGSGPK
ncbi:MAG: hypothetical protein U1F26_13290 [Lysobacterales bacterium]